MCRRYCVSNSVVESDYFELINQIDAAFTSMTTKPDDFHLLEIKGNTMTHSQNNPRYECTYAFEKEYEEISLYVVMTEEEDRRYWTVMFPWEY